MNDSMFFDSMGLKHTDEDSPHIFISNAKKDIDVINSILMVEKPKINIDARGEVCSATTSLIANIGHASIVIASLQTINTQLRMEILELRNQLKKPTTNINTEFPAMQPSIRSTQFSAVLKAGMDECNGESSDNTDCNTSGEQQRTISSRLTNANHRRLNETTFSQRNISKRRPIIRGIGVADSKLKTVEQRRHVHAFSFTPDTTTEQIEAYIKKKDTSSDAEVEKVVTKGDYASFRISFPASKTDDWLKPEMWPVHTRIN
jgi:hypothetical protein